MAPWKRLGGRGSYIQLYGTEGLVGHLCRRDARRRRAQCRAASLREGRAGRRRPRLDRSLAGRPEQAAVVRMAEGLAVHDPAQRFPPLRQCDERAGAAAVRHLRAEHDEPARQSGFHLQLPAQFHRALFRRRRFLQAERRCRARPGARPRHAAHQSHSRHHQLPNCRSTTAARPATAASSRRWPATASICGSASTRPAAIPRRTSTPPPPCSSASRARATPTRGRKRSAPRRGRTARPTRSCGRITNRSAWSRPRR